MPFAQDKDFVGREDIFTSLDKGFSQSASLQRMALAGLGGIGFDILDRDAEHAN